MNQERSSWPIIVGITAGVVGSVVAGYFLYSTKTRRDQDGQLRDASEIIAQCHQKIKEIEAGLNALR